MTDGEDIIEDFFNLVFAVMGGNPFTPAAKTEIEEKMRTNWAGREIYIRKRESEVRAARIRAEFNGRNREDLQLKYGISKKQFYRDLKGQ